MVIKLDEVNKCKLTRKEIAIIIMLKESEFNLASERAALLPE